MDTHSTQAFEDFLAAYPRLTVLSGAGISADAGIPTYRDKEGTWLYSKPIQEQEFLEDEAMRTRYWARSMRGWPVIRDAIPTPAHTALARLEHNKRIHTVITQNVDRLHQKAGSERVIDLHGRLDKVRCLRCETTSCRDDIQKQLQQDNPEILEAALIRPDGDADLAPHLSDDFAIPACEECSGTLMPDVVFFGGSVPREKVDISTNAIAESDALLVIGSSLQVLSGFRFCRLARELDKPIAIINPGKTRADAIAQVKIKADCQLLMTRLLDSAL